MNIFEVLAYEHALIAKVMQVGQSLARRMALHGAIAEPVGADLTGFCEQFTSHYHQAKEFRLFIALLNSRHSARITPIFGLHHEHSQLSQLTGSLTVAWQLIAERQAGGCELFAGYLADYVSLMQEHLLRENRFYAVVAHLLDDSDPALLDAAFVQIEQETVATDGQERYVPWAVCQAASA